MAKRNKTTNQRLYAKEIKNLKARIKRAEKAGYVFDNIIPEKPTRITKQSIEKIKNIRGDVLYTQATSQLRYIKGQGVDYYKPQTKHELYSERAKQGVVTRKLNEFKKRDEELEREREQELRDYYRYYSEDEYEEQSEDDYYSSFNDDELEDYYIDEAILNGIEDRISSFSEFDFPTMWTARYHAQNKDQLEGLLEMAIADEGRQEIARRLNSYGNATEINEIVDRIMYDSNDNSVRPALQQFAEIIYGGALTQQASEYGY